MVKYIKTKILQINDSICKFILNNSNIHIDGGNAFTVFKQTNNE